MDKLLTTFLLKKGKLGLAPIDYLLLVGMTVAGVMLRITMWNAPLEHAPYQNLDDTLKLITALFDVLVAVIGAAMVLYFTKHRIKAMLAYGILFVLPPMVAGSAVWGMGDSIYVFIVLVSLYLLMLGRKNSNGKLFVLSLIVYGVALLLNAYALFVFPLYLIVYLTAEGKGNHIFGFSAPLLGMGLHQVLDKGSASFSAFFAAEGALSEARYETLLSYNYPNVYQIFGPASYIHEYGSAMRVLVLVMLIVIPLFALRRPYGWDDRRLLFGGVLLCIWVPYVMPFMDERAGLLAAVLSVIYGFVCIEQFFVPIIQVTICYLAYAAYFRGDSFLPLSYIAIAQLLLAMYLVFCYVRDSHKVMR